MPLQCKIEITCKMPSIFSKNNSYRFYITIECEPIQSEIMPQISRKSNLDPNDETGAIMWMDST